MALKLKPSRKYYLIPVLTVIIGMILFIVCIYFDVKREGSTELNIGDSTTIEFEEGRYYILLEDDNRLTLTYIKPDQTIFMKKYYDNIKEFSFVIKEVNNPSNQIKINKLDSLKETSRTHDEKIYTSKFYFEIKTQVKYLVETNVLKQSSVEPFSLSIQREPEFALFTILKYLFVVGLTFIAFISSFLIITLKRRHYFNTMRKINPREVFQ